MLPAHGHCIVEAEVGRPPRLVYSPRRLWPAEEEALAADLAVGADASAAVGVVETV